LDVMSAEERSKLTRRALVCFAGKLTQAGLNWNRRTNRLVCWEL